MLANNSNNKDLIAFANKEFDDLQIRFSQGDDIALLEAFRYAGMLRMPPPDWAMLEVSDFIDTIILDSQVTLKTTIKLSARERHIRLFGLFIYKRIEEEREHGAILDELLYEKISKECASASNINRIDRNEEIGHRTIKEIYYDMKRKAKKVNIPL